MITARDPSDRPGSMHDVPVDSRDAVTQLSLDMSIAKPEPAPTDRPANAARFSPCGLYRYELTRELGGDRTLVSIGLNPSTADANEDDQTIRKDVGFATRWGCGRVLKLNANAFCARDPKVMRRAAKSGIDVIGPDNDRTIREALKLVLADRARLCVSWGANIDPLRQRAIADLIEAAGVEAWCLGTNDDGSPEHELFIPYARPLVLWTCPPVPEKRR